MKFTLGSDPELFIFDTQQDQYISAEGFSTGTKDSPELLCQEGAVQVDGMAIEFNPTPAGSAHAAEHNLKRLMLTFRNKINEDANNETWGRYMLVANPTVKFSDEVWDKASEVSKELGCQPDQNAWEEGDFNPKPKDIPKVRAGGGHIHIGWTKGADPADKGHLQACIWMTKQLDIGLGLQSLLWDDDDERRSMYGKAGSFRAKPYGMEYRTLSNAWVGECSSFRQSVMSAAHDCAMRLGNQIRYFDTLSPDTCEEVRVAINNSDREFARDFIRGHRRSLGLPMVVNVGE